MTTMHHPDVAVRPDGRYEVRCPECAGSESVPVGIDLPLADVTSAARICQNHLLRNNQPARPTSTLQPAGERAAI